MSIRRDIDDAIQGWPYDPEHGTVLAREVRAHDGRTVLQIRVELGILQLEVGGRPDGTRPRGFASILDYLRYRAAGRGQAPGGKAPPWVMSSEHCIAVDRELVQYYHRRMAWLWLQRYDRALLDADHTLALLDFVRRHGKNQEYITTLEGFRGLVLFHRTQAAAGIALERRKPEEAIDVVREGIERVASHHRTWFAEDEDAESSDSALIEQLRALETEIRANFEVDKTLHEQLDEAVAREDYECAARLRDQIRLRTRT